MLALVAVCGSTPWPGSSQPLGPHSPWGSAPHLLPSHCQQENSKATHTVSALLTVKRCKELNSVTYCFLSLPLKRHCQSQRDTLHSLSTEEKQEKSDENNHNLERLILWCLSRFLQYFFDLVRTIFLLSFLLLFSPLAFSRLLVSVCNQFFALLDTLTSLAYCWSCFYLLLCFDRYSRTSEWVTFCGETDLVWCMVLLS